MSQNDGGSSTDPIQQADQDQQSHSGRDVDSGIQPCTYRQDSVEMLVLIPRKPANVFDKGYFVKPLLPARYPCGGNIMDIEYNFYPDLNQTRSITAVVTHVSWDPKWEPRPEPVPGKTVYFAIESSGGVVCELSADSDTSDADGMASVDLTIRELPAKGTLQPIPGSGAGNVPPPDPAQVMTPAMSPLKLGQIKVVASLAPASGPGNPSLTFTVHRNEDVDAALAPTETPDDFAATLDPVLQLQTWIVAQKSKQVASNGAKAVQQLLNQVACRKQSGGHGFLKPDGMFGPDASAEAGRFLNDFGTKAGETESAADAYRGCHFGVDVEQDDSKQRGVKTYVEAEYGSYTPGAVIDAFALQGLKPWAEGGAIIDADGLLDIYRAVVWEYLEAGKARAQEYVDFNTTAWYRHPNDNGPGWPAMVTQGVSYWYGGFRKLEDFAADLTHNTAPAPLSGSWFDYRHYDRCRIGLHGSGDTIEVPTATYNLLPHLHNDPNISNTGTPNHPKWRIKHNYTDDVKRQYTGIDCSAYCHRIALETKFRAGHCSDLDGQRICLPVPHDSENTRLATSTWPDHYLLMSSMDWRRDVIFRGDLLNSIGHHTVMVETALRTSLSSDSPGVGDLWIYQAHGETKVQAAVQAIWPQTECVRRVVYSPLRQWPTAWDAWNNDDDTIQFGRVYLWP